MAGEGTDLGGILVGLHASALSQAVKLAEGRDETGEEENLTEMWEDPKVFDPIFYPLVRQIVSM